MAMTSDRVGVLFETIHDRTHLRLAAGAVAYRGALLSFDAAGFGVPAADNAAQAGKKVLLALHGADNSSGQNGDVVVHCVAKGTILVPVGTLTAGANGRVAHTTDDDRVALASANNRAFGRIIDVRGDVIAVEIN